MFLHIQIYINILQHIRTHSYTSSHINVYCFLFGRRRQRRRRRTRRRRGSPCLRTLCNYIYQYIYISTYIYIYIHIYIYIYAYAIRKNMQAYVLISGTVQEYVQIWFDIQDMQELPTYGSSQNHSGEPVGICRTCKNINKLAVFVMHTRTYSIIFLILRRSSSYHCIFQQLLTYYHISRHVLTYDNIFLQIPTHHHISCYTAIYSGGGGSGGEEGRGEGEAAPVGGQCAITYISIYIYICMYVYIYIYIYKYVNAVRKNIQAYVFMSGTTQEYAGI